MGTPSNVLTGPGDLYVAPIGTAEPASATATLNAAFRNVGYTDGGINFSYALTAENITVDQELDPVRVKTTGRVATVQANLAEVNRMNLALALNAGADAAATGTIEPPDPGSEVRVMVLFETEEGARWLFRRCLQTGTINMSSQKGAQKRLIPVTFSLEKPDGADPFIVWPSLSTSGVV